MSDDTASCGGCGSPLQATEKFCAQCGRPARQFDTAMPTGFMTPHHGQATAPVPTMQAALEQAPAMPSPLSRAANHAPASASTIPGALTSTPPSGSPWGTVAPEPAPQFLPQQVAPAAPPAHVPPQAPQIYVQNTIQQNQQINITPQVHLSLQSRQTPFVLRAIWFLFIGWWATGLMITLGYIAMLTIVGIPLALFLFHRIPQALTLRERTRNYKFESRGDATYITEETMAQQAWYLRAVFFLLVGWWFGDIWLVVAYILSILILTLPIGVMMFNRAGAAFTLQRH